MGGCGTRSYPNISREKIDLALNSLKKIGATIRGDNPWSVDPHYFGVKLSASWNAETQVLDLTVTASDSRLPCNLIWNYLDQMILKYR